MSGRRALDRICRRSFRYLHLRRSLSSNSKEDIPSSSNITRLAHRSLVSIKGRDGTSLLQGLITVDVSELSSKRTMYSMLLNAQGRVLYDIILYQRGEDDLVMECDLAVQGDLIKHLKRHALRSQVSIESDASCDVWTAFPGAPGEPLGNVVLSDSDPRVRLLGTRILAPVSSTGSELAPHLQISTPEDYHRHRLEVGVAEGPAEVPVGSCFPLEYNGDYMNGVSFHKGCYIGQELTARTHHSGVVRKRVVPVTFDERAGIEISHGTKIMSESGKNIGKLVTCLGGLGLALLRVKEMKAPLSMQGEGAEYPVTAHTPSWWPKSGLE